MLLQTSHGKFPAKYPKQKEIYDDAWAWKNIFNCGSIGVIIYRKYSLKNIQACFNKSSKTTGTRKSKLITLKTVSIVLNKNGADYWKAMKQMGKLTLNTEAATRGAL